MNPLLNGRLLRFGIVGMVGMAVDFSVTWLFKERIGWNKYVANSLGFSSAVVCNFLLNRYWTFQAVAQAIPSQFFKFLLVSLIGLLINNCILFLLVKYLGRNFYFLKLVVIGIVFFWNYFANTAFTFKP